MLPDLGCSFYRKKAAKNAKNVRDDNAKELFENGEWARNGERSLLPACQTRPCF